MEILFTEEQIDERAGQIGRQISKDYAGKSLILVGILRGSVPWMANLMKRIDLEDVIVDFMACSSYGSSKTTSGQVKINKDLEEDIRGKDVIIVEDIIDSGITLQYLKGYFENRGAASIKVCALLDKPEGRKTDIVGDYIGFTVDDRFIVGYGLDFDQRYRQLPYISWIPSE